MTRAPISCPRCPDTFPAAGQLAAHLSVEHGVSASAAIQEARKAADGPSPQPAPEVPPQRVNATREVEEKPMPERKCSGCGAPGKRRDSCPTCNAKKRPAGRCGYCHHEGGAHSKTCKRKPGAFKDVARALAQELLTQLEGIRSKLDVKIVAVRELVEIL